MKQLLLGMVTTLVALTVGTPQWETSLVSTAVHVSERLGTARGARIQEFR